MDLNFLVFPKPNFRCQNDSFYSKLLFVPKHQRQIKNLVLKKASMMNKSSDKDSEGEGSANVPYSMARQSFDFSKFKGATAPIMKKSCSKLDCDLKEEEHEVNIKQEIRTCEKKVRLPKNRNATSILKIVGQGNKDIQPLSRIADIKKLTIQSSRFTTSSKTTKPTQGTLSKLMNDLDNFKRTRPNEVKLISQLEKRFNCSGSKPTLIEQSKNMVAEERSIDNEFDPPNERPTLGQERLGMAAQFTSTHKTGPMRIFPQKSLQQLKNKGDRESQEEGMPSPLQRFGSRALYKMAKDKARSSNSSLHLQTDPLEEVARLQSPQHIMLKYNGDPSTKNKLGDLFSKRRMEFKTKPVFGLDGIGSRTEVQLNILLKSDNDATTRNKNLLENPLSECDLIPCLLIKPDFPTDIVLLYFHANGEDIQQCQFFCELLKSSLNVAEVNEVLGHLDGVSWVQCLQVK